MEFLSGNFLCETIVPKDELIVSRTNLKGIITYANDTFSKISGYTIDELIGKPHNILRHPDMPKIVFNELWKSLETKGFGTELSKILEKMKVFIGFMQKYLKYLKMENLLNINQLELQFLLKKK